MICHYCKNELDYNDYYGNGIPGSRDFKKIGYIYKCGNEQCESQVFNHYFHTDQCGDLKEGYPC